MGSLRRRHSTRVTRARSLKPPLRSACSVPRATLTQLLTGLECVEAVLISAAAALRHQHADIDNSTALVLQRCGSDVLSSHIETLRPFMDTGKGGAS